MNLYRFLIVENYVVLDTGTSKKVILTSNLSYGNVPNNIKVIYCYLCVVGTEGWVEVGVVAGAKPAPRSCSDAARNGSAQR